MFNDFHFSSPSKVVLDVSKRIFKLWDKELLIVDLLRIFQKTRIAPEILELDMNPLICYDAYICHVDIRIRIEK